MTQRTVIGAALLVVGMSLTALRVAGADNPTQNNPSPTDNKGNPTDNKGNPTDNKGNPTDNINKMSAGDKTFTMDAAKGSLAEIDIGQIAADHGGSAEVIKFGQQMVQDHTRMSSELRQIAARKDVNLPTEMDAKDKAFRDKLMQATQRTGVEFDREYLRRTIQDHEKAVDLFQREGKNGKDPDVTAWAQRNLPSIQEHLRTARNLNDNLKKKQTAKR